VFVCSSLRATCETGDRKKAGQLPALRRWAVGQWSGWSKPLPLPHCQTDNFYPEQQPRPLGTAFRH